MLMAAKMSGMLSAADAVPLTIADLFDVHLGTASTLDGLSTSGWDLLIGKSRVNSTDWSWRNIVAGLSNTVASNQLSAIAAFSSYATILGSGNALLVRAKRYPGFVDVVRYTGDGVAGRAVAHGLGSAPGMIAFKSDASANWRVYHRSLGGTKAIRLNGTEVAVTNIAFFNDTDPTDSVFTLGDNADVNGSGVAITAILFAHDTSASGLVQCGFVGGSATVTLGRPPQFLMLKTTLVSGDWRMVDSVRGIPAGGDPTLLANSNAAESSVSVATATGTGFTNNGGDSIYLAVLAP